MFLWASFYRSGPIPFKIGGPRDYVCPERFPARLPRHSSLDVKKIDCAGERTRSGRVSRGAGLGFLIPNQSVGLSQRSVRYLEVVRGNPGMFRR